MGGVVNERLRGAVRRWRARGQHERAAMPPAQRLLALYPRQWRRRYEAELVDLLAQTPCTPRLIGDLVVGALDAHLWPQFGAAHSGRSLRAMIALAVLVVTLSAGVLLHTDTVLRAGASLSDQLLPSAATASGAVHDRAPQTPVTVQKAES